jgi:hypothetical protein
MDVNPIAGLKAYEAPENSDCKLGVAIIPNDPPTARPKRLRTIRSVPLLKPIQPKINIAAARKMSIIVIYI